MVCIRIQTIVCSAVVFTELPNNGVQLYGVEKGLVLTGMRHHHCYATLKMLQICKVNNVGNTIEGFITSFGRFVDRVEAAEIAYNCGQIDEKINVLFSENLF